MTLRNLLIAWVVMACSPATASEPAAKAPAAATSAETTCARHRARVAEEVCTEGSTCAELPPCHQRLDLDGDGTPDRVELADGGSERLILAVHWGDGRKERIEKMVLHTEGDRETVTDLSWLVAWRVAPKGKPLAIGLGLEVPLPVAAKGDGLWMSSTDAAVLAVLGPKGLELHHLGY